MLARTRAWRRGRASLAGHALVLLLAASWRNVPATSLPADDGVLARAAGCTPREWKRIRDTVLADWTLCSDGRLYFAPLAQMAVQTYAKLCQQRRAWSVWVERKRAVNFDRKSLISKGVVHTDVCDGENLHPDGAKLSTSYAKSLISQETTHTTVCNGQKSPILAEKLSTSAPKSLISNEVAHTTVCDPVSQQDRAEKLSTLGPKSLISKETGHTDVSEKAVESVASDAQPGKKTSKRAAKPKSEASAINAAVWHAYAEGYRARYGVEPVRNAAVAGQIAMFVRRVPAEEAPEIARWYCQHRGARYVAGMHPIRLLLYDAEKLRTEWITGRQMTASAARQQDRVAATADAVRQALDIVRSTKGGV